MQVILTVVSCDCETRSDSFYLFEEKLRICVKLILKYVRTWLWDKQPKMHSIMFTLYRHVCSDTWSIRGRGLLRLHLCFIYLCLCVIADTQRWPCLCFTTPDTAPGEGWQWWLLWCGSSPLPSLAPYCLDWLQECPHYSYSEWEEELRVGCCTAR